MLIMLNYYGLSKKSDVIIKFSRRNDCQHVLSVKRDLRKLYLDDLGFLRENKIYINRKSEFMSTLSDVMVQK